MERDKRTMALEVRQLKAQVKHLTKKTLDQYATSPRAKQLPINFRKKNGSSNYNSKFSTSQKSAGAESKGSLRDEGSFHTAEEDNEDNEIEEENDELD